MKLNNERLQWDKGYIHFHESPLTTLWTSEVWWASCVLNHSLYLRSRKCLKNSSFTHRIADQKGSNFLRNVTLFPWEISISNKPLCLCCFPCSLEKGATQISRFMSFSWWHRKDLHIPCQKGCRLKVWEVNRVTSLSLLFLKQWLRDRGLDADVSAKMIIYTQCTSRHFTPMDILMAAHTYPVTIKEMCFRVYVAMCLWTGRLCKQRPRNGEGVLAALVVINHLGAQYPLTFALFDLDRSKMLVLKWKTPELQVRLWRGRATNPHSETGS